MSSAATPSRPPTLGLDPAKAARGGRSAGRGSRPRRRSGASGSVRHWLRRHCAAPCCGGGTATPASEYSFSLLRRVRIEMPRMLAAWVRLPRQWLSVSMISCCSTAATVWPTKPRVAASAAIEAARAVSAAGEAGIGWPSGRRMANSSISLDRTTAAPPGAWRSPARAHCRASGGSAGAGARSADSGRSGTPLAAAYLLDEVLGQREDVAGPLAQRRQAQVHHVEAVEQVLAERAVAAPPGPGRGWRWR